MFQLVTHDLAGERIVAECARLRNQDLGQSAVQLFKNNTDYSGHSYGTHDNFLIPRNLPFDKWVEGLVPFLVTRQLFAGAGKVGSENRKGASHTGLQLSQRADFIESLLSIETMTERPIINTRDEPHAQPDKYRRLHLILGDANMSAYATALRAGTTRLVLTLIGEEKLPGSLELLNPVQDVKLVSRDKSGKILLKRDSSGRTITPLEIQYFYLDAVEQFYEGQCKETDWVIHEWRRTLEQLEHSPEKLADRIDWAIKEKLFTQFMEDENLDWDDPWLKSLDLEYRVATQPAGGFYRKPAEHRDHDRASHHQYTRRTARPTGQIPQTAPDSGRRQHVGLRHRLEGRDHPAGSDFDRGRKVARLPGTFKPGAGCEIGVPR